VTKFKSEYFEHIFDVTSEKFYKTNFVHMIRLIK